MSVGLVLEGGGMRGAYTSGVLETFLEHEIGFPVVYGISAGACNALSFISGQKNWSFEVFSRYLTDERSVGAANLEKTGSLFGFDFIFGELFHKLVPLDYDAFFRSPTRLRAGATDLNTGRVVFFDKEGFDGMLTPVRASSSLPFLSNIVAFAGRELLDGGVAMPIPIERSVSDGNRYNVVVLTRDISYRKPARPEHPRAALEERYGDYPLFVDAMMRRNGVYNGELDACRRQEEAGRAVVIRPSSPILTDRYEKDPERLKAIYGMGLRDAEQKLGEVKELLKKGSPGQE